MSPNDPERTQLALKIDYNRHVTPTSPRSPSDAGSISSEYSREMWSARYYDSKKRIDDKSQFQLSQLRACRPLLRRGVNAYLPKPADRPPADKFRQPVDGTLIESERNWGHGELFPVTYEDIALTV